MSGAHATVGGGRGSAVLGCVADDHTGGTDVAAALRRSGLRTVLRFGLPQQDRAVPDCDAVVVALKTRSIPPADAVAASRAAHDRLTRQGVGRIYFKYCSTFDSTDEGNIGPVADMLTGAAGGRPAVVCPAAPEHGRTVYQGHLFVGDRLLSDSPMRDHPLTPMTDSDLVRVLARQTPHPVALIPHSTVARGPDAVRAALDELETRGVRYAVTDAISDHDLDVIARAAAHLPVLTGAAGLARAMGALTADGTDGGEDHRVPVFPSGPAVVLAGSCSAATLEQVALARRTMPSHRLRAERDDLAGEALGWLEEHLTTDRPVLVYSSAPPGERSPGAAVAAAARSSRPAAHSRPGQEPVLIIPSELISFGTAALTSLGVPEPDARLVADSLVTADLRGHPSHGMLRLEWYADRLRSGAMHAVTDVATVLDGGAVAVLDGRDGIGQVITAYAAREAVRRAREHGVGVVAVRDSNHFGTAAYFTRMMADEGCVALLTTNGSPAMAPWGGREKSVGANPWSIAVPGGRRGPVVLDIANTTVARGKIYAALERDQPIPEGWAQAADGSPTTDPRQAIDGLILPMAGHKGYGISFMMDVLSGVLTGSSYATGVAGPYVPDRRSGCGHLLLALRLDAVADPAEYARRLDDLIDRTKAVRLAPGFDEIFYPGEIEDRNAARAEVRLPDRTLRGLERLAGACAIPLPGWMSACSS